MSCEMIYFVTETYHTACTIQNHFHPYYELVYYLKGTGQTTIAKKQYSFRENTFALIKPKHIHNEHEDGYVKVMFMGFDANYNQLSEGIFSDPDGTIRKLMCKIDWEMQHTKSYYRTMLNILTEEIILHVLRTSRSHAPKDDSFEYIQNYIDSNATKNISIQQIAESLGYSYDYLRHLFCSKMNITAKQYLLNVKLENVKNLLLRSDASMHSIASMTGFSSASHMCAVFKKFEHMTPLEYRTSQKNNLLRDNKKSLANT